MNQNRGGKLRGRLQRKGLWSLRRTIDKSSPIRGWVGTETRDRTGRNTRETWKMLTEAKTSLTSHVATEETRSMVAEVRPKAGVQVVVQSEVPKTVPRAVDNTRGMAEIKKKGETPTGENKKGEPESGNKEEESEDEDVFDNLTEEEGTENEMVMEQGTEEASPMEQGTKTYSSLVGSENISIDLVSNALTKVKLRTARPKEINSQDENSKLTGLAGRKYSAVVQASPKKRLLLNRLYGTKKVPGNDLKLKSNCGEFLAKKVFGATSNMDSNKGESSSNGQGRKGGAGEGVPKPSSKK
ncbi:unnamed protein product [Cochlearia groenlandica]